MAAAPAPPGGRHGAPRIAVLPPAVAARIAAGEVIERPASVVKELLENALDAGARRIEVLIEAGGAERIRVRDDGHGIAPEQLADAFERHATSKLRHERDLFTVQTLGFRGEALAAIAAAAAVDLTSRTAGASAAAVARYRDGRPAGLGAAAAEEGTAVDVRRLFAAMPARRRFLGSARVEARAVWEVVADYALARPDVALRLEHDGRVLLASEGSGPLAEAVAAVHGAEAAAQLLPLAGMREQDGASAAVTGAVGGPALHRANRRYIHLFVNGRAIASRALTHAIEQAYAGVIPARRHPLAVVLVCVPPAQLDVNVHPRKAEVRLRHERVVYGAVAHAVREALLAAGAALGAPAVAPGVRSPRGEAIGWPQAAGAQRRGLLAAAGLPRAALPGAAPYAQPVARLAAEVPLDASAGSEASLATEAHWAEGEPLAAAAVLPALRALGQVDLTYVVAEGPDGLYLVDQHAAHERVLYERALAGEQPSGRPLLAAALAELTPAQAALAEQHGAALAALGWELAPTDGAALLVRALPQPLAGRDPATALGEYLDALEAEEGRSAPDRVAAALACHAAVRAGDRLGEEQRRELLEALERTDQPQRCPHGRPTMLRLGRDELERAFGRR